MEYGAADLLDLDHAYGLTVHRAQGSEWPGVVVLASSSFGPILSRNLLYTALTRARRAVVVVGDEAAIAAAVARTRDQERITGCRCCSRRARRTPRPGGAPPRCDGEGSRPTSRPLPPEGEGERVTRCRSAPRSTQWGGAVGASRMVGAAHAVGAGPPSIARDESRAC